MALGLSKTDLRSHAVTPLMRGVYLAGGGRRLDHSTRCAAALRLAGADGWVASLDAARLLGLPVPHRDRPSVSLPAPLRGRRLTDVALIPRREWVRSTTVWVPSTRTSVRVTHPDHVLPECLEALNLVDAVVLADKLLAQAAEPDLLRSTWQGMTAAHVGRAGVSRLRRVIDLAHPGAESPMETKARLLFVLAGFPMPVVQHPVAVEGRRLRLDLAYPQLRIGIEYDGSYHFDSEAQKHADIRRGEALTQQGWCIVKVVSRGILRDPEGTIDHLHRVFSDRGVEVRRSEEWRLHFAQHETTGGYRAG